MTAAAMTPMMSAMSHAGVLVFVEVLLLVFSSCSAVTLELSFTSDRETALALVVFVVWTLLRLPVDVWRLVLVVLTGCCVPVLSGALHVVSSMTSSTSVSVVPVSDDCCVVWNCVSDAVCWVRSLFCSIRCDRAVCWAFLTVLQLTAHRAVSSMRTIVDFLNSACEFAHIFT